MRDFIRITLMPDVSSGISAPVLMGHVMENLHLAFVQVKNGNEEIPVGISFPEYDEHAPTLGTLIRVHGLEADLNRLALEKYLGTLRDYVHITRPRPVPKARLKGYVAYTRVRHDHGKAKLIRRAMKRRNLSLDEAERAYSEYHQAYFPTYPFVLMASKSTGHLKYPLYLKQLFLDEPGVGSFNTFGINAQAGVEYF